MIMLDAHARAASPHAADDGASMGPDRLARRAHHALTAAPRSVDDARLAVDACRAAARSMVASFAYEQADALMSSAMALHDGGAGLPAPPGRLLVEWAQAAQACRDALGDVALGLTHRTGDMVLCLPDPWLHVVDGFQEHLDSEQRRVVHRTRRTA